MIMYRDITYRIKARRGAIVTHDKTPLLYNAFRLGWFIVLLNEKFQLIMIDR